MNAMSRVPRPGAVRAWDAARSEWIEAVPGDPWFSTVTMFATEYVGSDGVWRKVDDAADGGAAALSASEGWLNEGGQEASEGERSAEADDRPA